MIHFDRGPSNSLGQVAHLVWEARTQKTSDNAFKDFEQLFLVGLGHAQDVKVASEALRQLVAAAQRRRGAGEHHCVFDVFPETFLPVVDTS